MCLIAFLNGKIEFQTFSKKRIVEHPLVIPHRALEGQQQMRALVPRFSRSACKCAYVEKSGAKVYNDLFSRYY